MFCFHFASQVEIVSLIISNFQVFQNYLTFCGIGLTNAQLFDASVQEYKRNQVS